MARNTDKNPHTDQVNAEQQAKILEQENELATQRSEMNELQEQIESSRFDLPLLKIAEQVLMVPLVGVMDSVKSQKVMEDILWNIRQQETKVAVIDIAGVNIVDSSVATHLIKIAKATRLMGCKVIISGISPVIAQNIVNLGVDVTTLETTNTLKDAITNAYKAVGYSLVKNG